MGKDNCRVRYAHRTDEYVAVNERYHKSDYEVYMTMEAARELADKLNKDEVNCEYWLTC